jgi:hypothetical protein
MTLGRHDLSEPAYPTTHFSDELLQLIRWVFLSHAFSTRSRAHKKLKGSNVGRRIESLANIGDGQTGNGSGCYDRVGSDS